MELTLAVIVDKAVPVVAPDTISFETGFGSGTHRLRSRHLESWFGDEARSVTRKGMNLIAVRHRLALSAIVSGIAAASSSPSCLATSFLQHQTTLSPAGELARNSLAVAATVDAGNGGMRISVARGSLSRLHDFRFSQTTSEKVLNDRSWPRATGRVGADDPRLEERGEG